MLEYWNQVDFGHIYSRFVMWPNTTTITTTSEYIKKKHLKKSMHKRNKVKVFLIFTNKFSLYLTGVVSTLYTQKVFLNNSRWTKDR